MRRKRRSSYARLFLFEDMTESEFFEQTEDERRAEFEWFMETFQHATHGDVMRWQDDGGAIR